jgi:adenylylsulfate kinase-like enzyme
MSEIRPEALRSYLSRLYGQKVELISITGLGGEADPEKALKEYGYGTPMHIEVNVNCPLEVCAARDLKGIYRQAAQGQAKYVPSAQQEHEPPPFPEVTLDCKEEPEKLVSQILEELKEHGFI